MGLRSKFNLILIGIFLIGYVGSLVFVNQVMQRYAQEEVLHNAELMMQTAQAVRHYTAAEVKPLLLDKLVDSFPPPMVPSYAVMKTIMELQKDHPDYSYKDAVLNPTNPRDRATDWEAEIIQHYRDHPDEKSFHGIRETPLGGMLYLTRPIKIVDQPCLGCHTSAQQAPPSMIKLYGADNGFGWQLNDIVGAQIVSVPMGIPLQRAHHILMTFAAILAGVFLLLLLVANAILHFVVIRPVKAMAENANRISTGAMETPELQISGNDEIAVLARSFNRMHRSLANAFKIIERSRGDA